METGSRRVGARRWGRETGLAFPGESFRLGQECPGDGRGDGHATV